MYSIIIVSHGDFANGLKDTMNMIVGAQENTYFISFTPSDSVEDFDKKVKVIFRSIPKEHHILFLCDLFGGTPCHSASAFRYKYPERVEVLTGCNLPILMSAVLSSHMELKDVVEHLVEEAKKGIQRIEIHKEVDEEDE